MNIQYLISNFFNQKVPNFIETFYNDYIKLSSQYGDVDLFHLEEGSKEHLYSLVPEEHAQNCILLAVNGGLDIAFIWNIYPEKPLELNPIVWLNSYYEGTVVANSFQEFLIVNCFHLNPISRKWQYFFEKQQRGVQNTENPNKFFTKQDTDRMVTDSIEDKPNSFPKYLEMLKNKYNIIPTDHYPVEIVGNAFINNPNFMQWSIDKGII
jgi:hypothetical protein